MSEDDSDEDIDAQQRYEEKRLAHGEKMHGPYQYHFETPELLARLEMIETELKNCTQAYLALKARWLGKDHRNVTKYQVDKLRKQKRVWQKRRRGLIRHIKTRDDYKFPRKPHQIRKAQQGGGDFPEHTYFEVFCNDHPRWNEDDGLPGKFVRFIKGDTKSRLKLQRQTRRKFPKDWYEHVWREPCTAVYRLDWGVHNNTQTVQALLKWFRRMQHKTGDRASMIQFRRQHGLWYSRRWELSQQAQKENMYVIWPARPRHERRLFLLQQGFDNQNQWKLQKPLKEILGVPMDVQYKQYLDRKKDKYERDKNGRFGWAKNLGPGKCQIPREFKLPLGERKPINHKEWVDAVRYWKFMEDANLTGQYKRNQLLYILRHKLEYEVFPNETMAAFQTGKMGERLWRAVYDNKPRYVRRTLELRPDLKDYIGIYNSEPCVFTAARMNRTECLAILLEYGANLRVKGGRCLGMIGNESPLQYARRKKFREAVRIMEEEIDRRNARDGYISQARQYFKSDDDDGDEETETVSGEDDQLGGVAKDFQALSLTTGARKVKRCAHCTMPLPPNVRLPYTCKCGWKNEALPRISSRKNRWSGGSSLSDAQAFSSAGEEQWEQDRKSIRGRKQPQTN
uniref:Uncharacterized protein n=1 Tax=Amorphochlora amoebiformis TaxID=1561963 RepID=A0A7S0DTT1_9EUKA